MFFTLGLQERLCVFRDKVSNPPRDGFDILIILGDKKLGLWEQPVQFLSRRYRVGWVANPGQDRAWNICNGF